MFHADELMAQTLAGVSTRSTAIHNFMTEQHRDFFATLPHILVATSTTDGWPLATLLESDPGFVESTDPATLRIRALPRSGDPAAGMLRLGDEVGILGIDLQTRRRNRANGIISGVDAAGFTIAVHQSFGNCPQYIQRRTLSRAPSMPGHVREFDSLADEDARTLIARADTFFVASRSRAGVGAAGGSDISHRGGRTGFVHVKCDTLSIPDFRGNRYFNTLGNLLGEPRASLLFINFETGALLQIQGLGTIDWNMTAIQQYEGAERIWRFKVRRGWYRERAAELRGAFVDFSPMTLRTDRRGTYNSGFPSRCALQEHPLLTSTVGARPPSDLSSV